MGKTFKFQTPVQELVNECMRLWKTYSLEYRTLDDEYDELQGKLRAKNMVLKQVPEITLKNSPKVYFLSIEKQEEAEQFVNELSREALSGIIYEAKRYANSTYRQELTQAVFAYKYRLRHPGSEISPYATPPGVLH